LSIPIQLQSVRDTAAKAIAPIRPADESTKAEPNLLFSAQRTEAGRQLPPYYLVYFLLVDLLKFKNLGQFEKLAWSIPIDYKGEAFLIEHRKFGVGVFAHNPAQRERQAQEIVTCIKKAVKCAEPYFEWLANQAMTDSKLNVKNRTDDLLQRFEFFHSEYRRTSKELLERDEKRRRSTPEERMSEWNDFFTEPFMLHERNEWLASALIDAFFSFTEHVFIHLAILQGRVIKGWEVAQLATGDWGAKFKAAFDLSDPDTKKLYDDLTEIRRQHRNFVAHGSFGKRGEAFTFHTGAGAIPVLLPHQAGSRQFALTGPQTIEDPKAIQVILAFMEHLWSGARSPARIYLQRSSLPVILTLAADGTYDRAMQSEEEMESLVDHLIGEWERSMNMDW